MSLELVHRSTTVGDLVLLGRVHLGVPERAQIESGGWAKRDDQLSFGDATVGISYDSRLLESIRLEDRVPSGKSEDMERKSAVCDRSSAGLLQSVSRNGPLAPIHELIRWAERTRRVWEHKQLSVTERDVPEHLVSASGNDGSLGASLEDERLRPRT